MADPISNVKYVAIPKTIIANEIIDIHHNADDSFFILKNTPYFLRDYQDYRQKLISKCFQHCKLQNYMN